MARIALIICDFNKEITSVMAQAAKNHAKKLGCTVACEYTVPGAFDSPFALKKALRRRDVECAAVLGAVVKGGTDHDRVITQVAAEKISQLSLEYGKPVGLGIIGPNVSWAQAKKRAKGYAQRSVEAAVRLLAL